MKKFPPVYSDEESSILITVYENPDLSFDTYTLTQRLTQQTVADPKFDSVFKKIVRAIEELIVKGLIDGTQLKGGHGMYFSDLKLKYKGKQAAIQERDRIEEFKRQLPEMVERANATAEEIRRASGKGRKA